MKYCGKCGAPLREGKGFCPQCGAEVRHPEPVAEPIAEPIPEPVAAPVAEQPSAPAAVKERRPRCGLRRLVTALIVLVLLGGLGARRAGIGACPTSRACAPRASFRP